jgi:hypothetical protein
MNRQAQKLVNKFNTTVRYRMARANANDEPTEPLFHYTTEKALYSILQSETFWFTSIYHMDDKVELSFGFGMAHELLSAALKREGVLIQTFLKPIVEDFNFEKIKSRFAFYSASFGQRDDAQQWTDYAEGGSGIAMGLAPGFFALLNVKDPKPEETTFIGRVLYGEDQAKVRHAAVIDSAIWTVKEAFRRGLLLKASDEDEFLRHMAAEMYVEILWNSVTSKSTEWAHQRETRLLALNDLRNPKLQIHNAEKRPRVELPQPLLKPNVTEVMLGPKADEATKVRVRKFLDEHHLPHVPVTAAATQS